MGGIISCICCYCCLMRLKPRTIEIICLICNIIEIAALGFAIYGIPWSDIKMAGKITFFVSCGMTVLTLIILLALMCLRCGNKINTTSNSSGKCLSILLIIFNLIIEILLNIGEIIILFNKFDRENHYDLWDDYRNISNKEWIAAIFCPSLVITVLGIYFFCSIFLFKLINAKTNSSYYRYKESKDENNIASTTIGIYNNPPNVPNNQLIFIGYDKDGHPIYTGNTSNFSQQPIIINNPNNTNDAFNPGNMKFERKK